MANGLDKISLRIPAQWDPEWFRMVIRDVLSKADVRNAIGAGLTVSGNTDEPATLTASITSLSQLPDIATDRLLGRATAGTGDVETITCTAAGRALLDDAAASNQRTTLGLGTAATQATGTSGANVPLLNGANVHASAQCTLFAVGSATPAATQAANADTSGAVLAALETEVNELKATLRTFGLIAP